MADAMILTIKWIKAHRYEYKVINDNHIVFRTNYQTAEIIDNDMSWHPYTYFENF